MILALDLGTKTGWCLSPELHGTWDLTPRRFDGGGMRFLRFRNILESSAQFGGHPVTRIAFEEVRRHAGTDAAHVYGGLMATLTAWCEEHGIPYEGVPVGAIKKHWAGKGNASKGDMLHECMRRRIDVGDDNEADAVALWHLVTERGQ